MYTIGGLSVPNVKQYIETKLTYLPSDIFVNYIDILFKKYSSFVCDVDIDKISEYFVEINVTNLSYKISNNFLLYLDTCKLTNKEIFVIPINLRFPPNFETTNDSINNTSGHSNTIIIDNKHQTIEFFEPHGKIYNGSKIKFNTEKIIRNVISKILPMRSLVYEFTNVYNQCPYPGVQITNGDTFCLAWSLLFIEIRLMNRIYLASDIVSIISKYKDLFKYIKKYITYITIQINNSKKLLKYSFNSYPSTYLFDLTLNDITNNNDVINRIIFLLNEYNNNSIKLKFSTFQDFKYLKNKQKIIFNELISFRNLNEFQDIFLNFFENLCETKELNKKRKQSVLNYDKNPFLY